MKKIKNLLASLLVLASVSAPALAQSQWTEIDNLITRSQDVVDILDEGYRRIGGASALVGTNIVADNMLTGTFSYSNFGVLDYRQTLMDSTTTGNYNVELSNVADAAYSMTVQEYIDGQYIDGQEAFNAAIDTYIDAASVFAKAVRVNELATAAVTSGNVQDARALQDYINANNLMLTNSMIDTYNTSIGSVEDTVQFYSAVAILKDDATSIAAIQSDADAAGRDYIYANDAIYTSGNELQWGFTGPDGDTAYNFTRTVDMSPYVTTNLSTIRTAGRDDEFYTSGPTDANTCYFATPEQKADPADPCYGT